MTAAEKVLITSCPTCHHSHEVSDEHIGHPITCDQCSHIFNAIKFDTSVLIHTFVKIAVQNQLLDEQHLEEAKNEFEGEETLFPQRLVEKGMITSQDKSRLFVAALRKLNKKFTDIAVMHQYLSRENADMVLLRQAEDFKIGRLTLIGDILIKENLLDKDQINSIYKEFRKKKAPPAQVTGDEIYDKSGTLPLVGLIAIEKNIITRKQLEETLQAKKEAEQKGQFKYFEDILLEKGVISEDTLATLLMVTIRKLDKKFAEIVLKKGFADKGDMEHALFLQSEEFKEKRVRPLCEIIAQAGVLSSQEEADVFIDFKGLSRDKLVKLAKKAMSISRPPDIPKPASVLSHAAPSTASSQREMIPENVHAGGGEENRDSLIGELAVTYDMISNDDLKAARVEQGDPPVSLQKVLLEKKFVSKTDISQLVSKQAFLEARDTDLAFGKEAVKRGLATKDEIKSAFMRQSNIYSKNGKFVSIGDILVESKIISESDRDDLLNPRNRVEPLPEKGAQESSTPQNEEEAYNDEPEISVTISEDSLSAFVSISKDLGADISIAVDEWVKDIKEKVSEKGIFYGIISDSLISGCLKSSVLKKKSFKVASGDPPQKGKEGKIIYHFETDYKTAGVSNEDGVVDFKNRGDIPFIKAGELMAELLKTVQGKSGYDIFGNRIEVPLLPEVELKCGAGVELSENGLKVFAAIDGMPNLSLKDEISVLPEFVIKGDVNYEVGHIDFKGNVLVEGSVCQGFRVKAVNLTAKEIIGGEIDVTGDVNVYGGIIDAVIKAEGNVQAKFMYNTKVEAFGDLLIQKEMVDSKAMISGMCKNPRCKIITSRISARKGFEVAQIGTEVSDPCRLRAGVNDHLDQVIGKVKNILSEKTSTLELFQEEIEKIEKLDKDNDLSISENTLKKENLSQARQKALKEIAILKEKGETDFVGILEANVSKAELALSSVSAAIKEAIIKKDSIFQMLTASRLKAEKVIEEIEKLNDDIRIISSKVNQSECDPTVKVTGMVTSKTIIMGIKSSIILQEDMKHVRITEIKITDPEAKGPPRWEMAIRKLK